MFAAAPTLTLALAQASMLGACGAVEPVPIVGTIERHRIEVAAPAAEQVAALLVREGERVERGQVLAELDASALDAAKAVSAAQLRVLQARLAELRNGARAEELTQARAVVSAAEAQRELTAREFRRVSEINQRGLASASLLDAAREARERADAQASSAAAALALLQQGTRREQLAQADAAVQAGASQLTQQQVLRQRLQLVAPIDGVIEALTYRVGERPPMGAPVVVMLDGGVPFARVYIPEPLLARVRPGLEVQVRADGLEQPLRGVVRYLAGEAAFTPYYALTQRDRGRLAYLAEIDLPDAAAAALPVGLPITVTLPPSATLPPTVDVPAVNASP